MSSTDRVTIHDVARAAGVSVATVSKVINERYGVAAATFARVRAVVDELGYEPSLVARSLRNYRTNVLGILVRDIDSFTAELLKGAARAIKGTDYELVVYSAGRANGTQVAWETSALTRLSGTLIDGAVIVAPTSVARSFGAPVVAVGAQTGQVDVPAVDSDNLRGAQLGVQHLLDLGHRRIGFIAGRPDLESARLRELGYCRALENAGIPLDRTLIRVGDYAEEASARAARELLALPDRPTAIFGANDLAAIAAMGEGRRFGLEIPEELSVVGFDDVPDSAMTQPALTTVHQPIQELGQRAIEILLILLRGETLTVTHETMPTRLVLRSSTAAARGDVR